MRLEWDICSDLQVIARWEAKENILSRSDKLNSQGKKPNQEARKRGKLQVHELQKVGGRSRGL